MQPADGPEGRVYAGQEGDDQSLLRVFAADSSYNLIREALAAILAFVISIVAARGLGTEGYGLYGLAILIPGTAVALLSLSLPAGLVYAAGRAIAGRATLVKTALSIGSALGLGALALFTFIGARWGTSLFPGLSNQLWVVALLAIPVLFLFNSLIAVIQGQQDFKTYNIIQVMVKLLLLVFMSVSVYGLAAGALGATVSWLAAYTSAVLLIPALGRRPEEGTMSGGESLTETTRQALGYGLRAHIGNLMAFLSYRIDRYLLVAFVGPGGLGIYLVASGLAERLWMLSTSAGGVLFPRIASLHGDERSRMEITSAVARHVFSLTLILGVVLGALAAWLVRLLYGSAYASSAAALVLLIPGVVFLSLSRILANDLSGRGRPELNSYVAVLGLATNVVANLALIPTMAAAGAALASTISYSTTTLVKLVIYHRVTEVPLNDLLLIKRNDLRRIQLALARLGSGLQ